MQITWLLGNGFDLSFKLKTSYSDFYEYLFKNEENLGLENNKIYSILKDNFKDSRKDEWKDYELKLGIITEKFSEKDLEKFKNDKLDLDDYLREFLIATIKDRIELTKEQKFKIMSESLQDIVNDKKAIEREKVVSILRQHKSETCFINAISFNYTDTVTMVWQHTAELQSIKIDNFPQPGSIVKISQPFYLHGTLDNNEMIIGLGNQNQIKNTEFSDSEIIQESLLKNKLLDIAGQRHFQKYKELISNSHIICLFGMSIGPTDQDYWEIIKKRLLQEGTLLIVYWFDQTVKELSIIRFNDFINEIKEKFCESSNATLEEKKAIMPKILVEINHNIFGNLISNNEEN